MKRVLSSQLPERGREVELPSDEAHHLTHVFRLSDGARVEAIDGKGTSQIVELKVRGKKVFLRAIAELTKLKDAEPIWPIVLEVAILKGDAMEWLIEKCVELGVSELRPLQTAHTVVQVGKKGPEAFQERWQKIADQSLKQCGRKISMKVQVPQSLEAALLPDLNEMRLIADEAKREVAQGLPELFGSPGAPSQFGGRPIHLLIGPEGGWSGKERDWFGSALPQKSVHWISLGPRVLRAETAALFTISQAIFGIESLSLLDKGTHSAGV